jgi:hypothetical protein
VNTHATMILEIQGYGGIIIDILLLDRARSKIHAMTYWHGVC